LPARYSYVLLRPVLFREQEFREMPEKRELRVLREPAVIEITGLSHSRIWYLEQEGKFPKRFKISGKACGWLAHEVQAYIASRVAVSRP
jgi:prophage regulatory protein